MRLQIALPADVGEIVRAQAEAEHRRVRQQIEFIVIKAVREQCGAEKTEPAASGVSDE